MTRMSDSIRRMQDMVSGDATPKPEDLTDAQLKDWVEDIYNGEWSDEVTEQAQRLLRSFNRSSAISFIKKNNHGFPRLFGG